MKFEAFFDVPYGLLLDGAGADQEPKAEKAQAYEQEVCKETPSAQDRSEKQDGGAAGQETAAQGSVAVPLPQAYGISFQSFTGSILPGVFYLAGNVAVPPGSGEVQEEIGSFDRIRQVFHFDRLGEFSSVFGDLVQFPQWRQDSLDRPEGETETFRGLVEHGSGVHHLSLFIETRHMLSSHLTQR